ncbi:MAG: hypothetical protein WAL47_19070 [Pyrinomonadaceae bacterium]
MSGSEKLIEIQQAKAAFRESEEHYRAVTDAATDAIYDQFRQHHPYRQSRHGKDLRLVNHRTDRSTAHHADAGISASSAQARNHALPGNWPEAYGVGSRAIAGRNRFGSKSGRLFVELPDHYEEH